jgi:hypothetical protein
MAEDAARELPNLPLEDALRLVTSTGFHAGSPPPEAVEVGGGRPATRIPEQSGPFGRGVTELCP